MRVSTQKQADDGYGLDAQLGRINDYCCYKNIDVNEIDIFVDDGYSGGTTERPNFARLIKAIEDDIYDKVIIYKLDRISRSIADFSKMLAFFSKHNVQLVIISEDLDLTSIAGSLIAKILIIFAEYERNIIIERTNEGIRSMILSNLYPWGGKIPFGYVIDKHKLSVDPQTAKAYKYMVKTFKECLNVKETTLLCKIKYPQYEWTPQTVIGRLRNRVYTGGVIFKDTFYPNLHEALITQEQYEKNICLLDKNSKEPKHLYLFNGIVYCAKCNSRLNITCGYNHQGRLYLYYRCTHCKKSISENKIITLLSSGLKRITLEKDISTTMQNNRRKLDNVTKKIKTLENTKKQLTASLLEAKSDVHAFIEVFSRIDKDIASLNNYKNKIEIHIDRQQSISFSECSRNNQYTLIHTYFEAILIDMQEKRLNSIKYTPYGKKASETLKTGV